MIKDDKGDEYSIDDLMAFVRSVVIACKTKEAKINMARISLASFHLTLEQQDEVIQEAFRRFIKKKVFISQPMMGKSNEQIRNEREELVKDLEEEGFEVIDSIVAETPEEAFNEPVYYLSQSILLLSQADYAYFMPGWDKARGCEIEHDICVRYSIKIMND